MSLDPVTMPVTPPAVPLPANVVLSADISFLWVPGQRPLTGWGGVGGAFCFWCLCSSSMCVSLDLNLVQLSICQSFVHFHVVLILIGYCSLWYFGICIFK